MLDLNTMHDFKLLSGRTSEVRGGWRPQLPTIITRWLSIKVEQVNARNEKFVEVIQHFQKFIESDSSILFLFQQMFNQVPTTEPYDRDSFGRPSVRDYMTMLRFLNSFLTEAPAFTSEYNPLACPIQTILQWPMATPAGNALFLMPSVNEHFRNVLNAQGIFLSSPASVYVISQEPGGWLSKEALEAMRGFTDDFIHDHSKPHWGFTSWDDFFTRHFKYDARPLPDPNIITSPCEGIVYNIANNVLEYDFFWLKENAYSLANMLANHEFVPKFVGGTVYQSFLTILTYHRWHSPVTGVIVDVNFIPGTYYSSSPTIGMRSLSLEASQGYLTSVATRVNIYIQADAPHIGLLCLMCVGMAEVSSCEVTVKKGEHVVQGQEIGMFHFGGSTSCLIFRPGTKLRFSDYVKVGDMEHTVKLNEPIVFVEA